MATGGGGGDASIGAGGGGVGGTEFYRVLVTGIPAPIKELFIKERLGSILPGEIVDINTQGTSSAVVTLRCEQGLSCKFPLEKDVDVGCIVTLYNLGTLHTTHIMENAPLGVVQEFERLAGAYGVAFQRTATGLALSGLIDSILNLRAEVDAKFLWKIERKTPKYPTASPSPQPADHAREHTAPRAPLAPPPGIPAHVLSRSDPSTLDHNPPTTTISGVKFDPGAPLHPPVLGAAAGHTSGHTRLFTPGGYLTTLIPSTTPSSLPEPGTLTTAEHAPGALPTSSHVPVDKRFSPPPEHGPTVHSKPDHPVSHGGKGGPPARKVDPPGDKAIGSDTAHTGLKSPSPPLPADTVADDASAKERPKVFTNLNPDALALVQRLPEGDIHGIEYHARDGSVHIKLEGESEVEEAITKFQEAYKKVAAHGRRLRAENVDIPYACSKEEVEVEIAKFEQRYLSTAFVLDEAKRVIRVISQARQFDQAKKFLEEALQKLPIGSVGAPDAMADQIAISFSQNRTLTLKKGDIVNEKATILVNAANGNLVHGSGVAGALNEASRGELQRHCNKYMETKQRGKEIPVGEVAVTTAGGKLACDLVIHAVGPEGYKHSKAQCEHLVKQVIRNTLEAAERCNATSIVLPAISCGVFDVSKDLVARCIIDTILGFNFTRPSPILSDIRIVILDGPTHSCFAHYLEQRAQPHRKGPGKGVTYSHTVDPPKALKNTEEKPLALEGVSLCLDDLDWIMPLLRKAAPNWKKILMKIGMDNEAVMGMTTKDEAMLLHLGVRRWLKQKQARATLDTLISALCNPEVGEGHVASEIMTAYLQRRGGTGEYHSSLPDVKYPALPSSTEEGSSSNPKSRKTESTESCMDTPSSPKDKQCPICLEDFKSPVKTKCGHVFCQGCIDKAMKYEPYCPACRAPLRAITGKQPLGGTMTHKMLDYPLPGYEGFKTIQIDYYIPTGTQGPEHPNPGHPYQGTSRTAYLPSSYEGVIVFKLLQKAFEARMIFTIDTSVTSGAKNVVVWNDIHHKTSVYGGQQNYGYPDPTYLQRVTEDLAAKGIVPD